MNQQKFIAPTYAPDLLARQLQLRQQAEMGQRWSEEGSQMPEGQMVSGHYVAPSITQYLAQALKSYMGSKAQRGLPDEMAGLQRDMQSADMAKFGLGPNPQALAQGLSGGQGAQAMPVDMQGGQAPQQQPQSSMPLLPGRSAEDSYLAYSLMGPEAYMKMAVQQGDNRTDLQKNLLAAGIQPGSLAWQQALAGNIEKTNYIAPVNAAPGSTVLDPRTNQPIFNAPQDGRQVVYGESGPVVQQVPGWNEAVAASEFAGARGTEAGKIVGQQEGHAATGANRVESIRAASALHEGISQLDRLKETASGIVNHPGFEGISGLSVERLSSMVPGTDAADAAAQFKTLKSQVAQNVLQMYRNMSETGGAVGQVSNAEQELFQNNLAALDRAQSPKAMRESMERIIRFVDESKGRMRRVFDAEYGPGTFDAYMDGMLTRSGEPIPQGRAIPGPASSGGEIPTISRPEQLQGLPSGTVFRAPDGSLRRVP